MGERERERERRRRRKCVVSFELFLLSFVPTDIDDFHLVIGLCMLAS